MENTVKFVRVEHNKWIHIDSIRVIERLEDKFYIWAMNQDGKCYRFYVDPYHADIDKLLKAYEFDSNKRTHQEEHSNVPNLLD